MCIYVQYFNISEIRKYIHMYFHFLQPNNSKGSQKNGICRLREE